MTELSNQEAKAKIDSMVNSQNKRPYDKKKGTKKHKKIPRSIYYYHASVSSGALKAVNFFYNNGNEKIEEDDLEDLIRALAVNAKYAPEMNGRTGYAPPAHGTDFGDVWRRKSYIVILLDDEDKRLLENGAVTIDDQKGAPNHTFYDAEDMLIDVSPAGDGSDWKTAVAFINHMKKDLDGNDLDTDETFCLTLHVEDGVGFTPYEAEGTNMGPPAPPPNFLTS